MQIQFNSKVEHKIYYHQSATVNVALFNDCRSHIIASLLKQITCVAVKAANK